MSKAFCVEQAGEQVVQTNERMNEQVAQYSMLLFLNLVTHCAVVPTSNTFARRGVKKEDR